MTLANSSLLNFTTSQTPALTAMDSVPTYDWKSCVHCLFLLGKARVTPLKPVMIPRLELTAALVSVKASQTLQEELEYDKVDEFFWTDSKVVLGYINNDAHRFHTFVANRVQQI